jgi:glutaminyl-tRNA synthetase
LYIERGDFEELPPKKYKRLSPGQMVRLRYGYIIRCDEVVKDAAGAVIELRCSYFPESKSGNDNSGLKPKGVVHWVSVAEGVACKVRVYGHLFKDPVPDKDDLAAALNHDSLTEYDAVVEPAVIASAERRFQFERQGYFARDGVERSVFNRLVSLRDSYTPPAKPPD